MEKDALVGNAADEGQVKTADVKANYQRDRDADDMAFILSDPRGRRVLWRYLGKCGVNQSSFVANSDETAFLEGKRYIGIELTEDMANADPMAFINMMKEMQPKAEDPMAKKKKKGRKGY